VNTTKTKQVSTVATRVRPGLLGSGPRVHSVDIRWGNRHVAGYGTFLGATDRRSMGEVCLETSESIATPTLFSLTRPERVMI